MCATDLLEVGTQIHTHLFNMLVYVMLSQIRYLMSNSRYVNKAFQIFFLVISLNIELQNLDLCLSMLFQCLRKSFHDFETKISIALSRFFIVFACS